MKKFIAAIIAVIMVLSLAACGGSKAPTIELESNTGYDYMEIYISPTSETSWGDDLLQGNTITQGDSAQIQLAPSEDMSYDMKIVDEDGDFWIFRNFTVADGARVVVSGSSMEVTANNRTTSFTGELQMNSTTEAPTAAASIAAGTMRINLANQAGDNFTYCYMSSSSSSDWGGDLFLSSTSNIIIFDEGDSGYIDVEGTAGSYDLKLADNSTDYVAWGQLPVHDGSSIIIAAQDGQWYAVVDGTAYAAAQAQGAFATASSTPAASGNITVNLVNNTDMDFYYCKCNSSDNSNWGDDLFTSSTSDIIIMHANDDGYILVASGDTTYDLKLETASSVGVVAEWYNLPLSHGCTVIISGNANGLVATVNGQNYTAQMAG